MRVKRRRHHWTMTVALAIAAGLAFVNPEIAIAAALVTNLAWLWTT